MQPGQLKRLDRARARKLLMHPWLVPTLAVASLGLLLLPGLVTQLGEEEGPTAPPAGDSPLDWAASDDTAGAVERYAALEPLAGEGVEAFPEIDDSWLETQGESAPAGGDAASTLACIIEPSQLIEIGSPVTGLIERIHAERSDLVEVGQVLVELESEAERAAVELARKQAAMNEQVKSREASAALGRRRRDRVKKLFDSDALSLDLRDEVETEAELARLELEQARADKQLASLQLQQALAVLKRRTIRSPISGIVVDRMMSPGERVDEEPMLKVAQIDPLRVEVILPSSMFGTIELGMRAGVVPEIPGDSVHVASVTVVDRVIDAASGTFGVRLELPNPEHAIPGGLHCQVRFLEE